MEVFVSCTSQKVLMVKNTLNLNTACPSLFHVPPKHLMAPSSKPTTSMTTKRKSARSPPTPPPQPLVASSNYPPPITFPTTVKSSPTTPKSLSFVPSLPFHVATLGWCKKVVHDGTEVQTQHIVAQRLSNTGLSLKKGRGDLPPISEYDNLHFGIQNVEIVTNF